MDKKTKIYIIGSLILGGIATLGVFLLKPSKKKNSLFSKNETDDKGTAGVDIQRNQPGSALTEPNWEDPFDPQFIEDVSLWVSPKSFTQLRTHDADRLAQVIHKAKGRFFFSNDDEEAISNLINQKLQNKVQFANVATAFFKRYEEDMEDYLESFLNDSEMQKHVYEPINNLKNYQLA